MKIATYANDDLTKNSEGINNSSANTILEALYMDKNIEPYIFQNKDITIDASGKINIQLYKYNPSQIINSNPINNLFEKSTIDLEDINKVFCKKDSPNKQVINYLGKTFKNKRMINTENMFTTATKEYVSQFKKYIPHTKISSNLENLIEEIKLMDEVIIKPNTGDRGRGIVKAKYDNGNINLYGINNSIKKYSEEEFQTYLKSVQKEFNDDKIIVQEFINKVTQGDKRILMMITKDELIYQPISLRVPQTGNYLANLYQGGTRVGLPPITTAEIKAIENISPQLYRDGAYIIGADFVGNKLIELNTVNPGFKLNKQEQKEIQLYKKIAAFANKI